MFLKVTYAGGTTEVYKDAGSIEINFGKNVATISFAQNNFHELEVNQMSGITWQKGPYDSLKLPLQQVGEAKTSESGIKDMK